MNNLHLSDEAQADLAGIKSYIAKNLENPSAAISTVRNITKDIRRWIVCSTAAGIIFASSLEMCRTTKQTNRDNLLHREKRFVTGTVCRDAGGFFYGRHIKIWTAIQR